LSEKPQEKKISQKFVLNLKGIRKTSFPFYIKGILFFNEKRLEVQLTLKFFSLHDFNFHLKCGPDAVYLFLSLVRYSI
jgi:hypothetical protein